MSQHTPGPWKKQRPDRSTIPVHGPSDDAMIVVLIASVSTWPADTDGSEGAANARLITASPELLAACENMLMAIHEGRSQIASMVMMRNALSKAIGADWSPDLAKATASNDAKSR